ncbi:MAG: hypothetical protein WBZ36_02990 [Candidatus Nitrosopolaris sp.]
MQWTIRGYTVDECDDKIDPFVTAPEIAAEYDLIRRLFGNKQLSGFHF